jgi:WD40 repeat protein
VGEIAPIAGLEAEILSRRRRDPDRTVPDVFISYSRPDGEFVHRLHAALLARAKDVWVDFEDIAPASNWANEVKEAIAASDSFVFVISPQSVASEQCRIELDRAASLNKRIIPLHLHQTDPKAMPTPLSAHNWVPQIGLFEDHFEAATDTLVGAIETDLEWVKGHTLWGQKALEWEQHDHDRGYLLSGVELKRAEEWLATQAGKSPPPTAAQTNLILQSRGAATRRLRRTRALVAGGLVVAIALAIVAVIQRQSAIDNQKTAKSRELAARAQLTLAADPAGSVQLSLEALETHYTDQAEAALRASLPRVELMRIVRSGHPFYGAAFSPDGSRFVTASTNGRLRIWDAGSGRLLDTQRVRHIETGSVDFARGYVLTAGGQKNAWLWKLAGDTVRKLPASPKRVTHAAFSADGSLVVTASQDGHARVYRTATGNELSRTHGFDARSLTAAAFAPGGGRIVTGAANGVIRIWNARTGRMVRRVGNQHRAVGDVEWSPTGDQIVTAGVDFNARIWSATRSSSPKVLGGHTGAVHAAGFSPNGARVATASADGTARIWDATTGVELNTLSGHTGPIFSVEFNPNENGTVVTASSDRTARVWHAASTEIDAALRGRGQGGIVNDAAFSPDGRLVVTASRGSKARIWKPAKRKQPLVTLPAQPGALNTAAFNRDGTEVVTASQSGRSTIWDAATGAARETLPGGGQPTYDAEFSPRGDEVVTASRGGAVTLWDVADRRRLVTLPGPHEAVNSAAFSPDGREVVTASRDGNARIWNVAGSAASRPKLVQTLRGHKGPVEAAAFSPDGTEVVTAAGDRTVRIWNTADGKQIARLNGHAGPVYTAEFSRNGGKVVSAGADGTARIWDPRTGRELTTLGGFTPRMNAAAFSPDGKEVVTAGPRDAATIWSTRLSRPLPDLERVARAELARIGKPYSTIR